MNRIQTHNQDMRRILFVLPPFAEQGTRASLNHHPIMTATLVGVAMKSNWTVGVLDSPAHGLGFAQTIQLIKQWQPDWVMLSPFEYRRELSFHVFESFLRDLSRHVSQIGLLNCPEKSPVANLINDELAHWVALGDSEPALLALLLGQPSAPGTLARVGDDVIVNPDPVHVDWSSLPFPAWDLFPLQAYRASAHRYRLGPTLPVLCTRTCPYKCDFCPQSLFNTGGGFTTRPMERVVEEISHLVDTYGVQTIEVYDPTFALRREDALKLCELLEAKSFPLEWICNTRCDLLDTELLERMASAGCRGIIFGVETSNNDILNATGKALDLNTVHAVVEGCRRLGIRTIASFVIGLPGETHQTLQESLRFSRALNPTFAQYHRLQAHRHNERWSEVGTFEDSWVNRSASFNGNSYIPNGFTNRSLQRYLGYAYLRFYTRPAKVLELVQQIQSMDDLRRMGDGVRSIGQHIFH
jgi:anaerobic magnesium-protoporphyrin IX monomethyl ester cyclase